MHPRLPSVERNTLENLSKQVDRSTSDNNNSARSKPLGAKLQWCRVIWLQWLQNTPSRVMLVSIPAGELKIYPTPLMTDGSTVCSVVPMREGSQSQEIGFETFISEFSANETRNSLHNRAVKHFVVGPAKTGPGV